MKNCGEDITEIEVKPDGSWRVKTKSESERREVGELALWHLSDGSLAVSASAEAQPKVEMSKQIKQEGISGGPMCLKLGIKKNPYGLWEVSKPEDANTSSGNRLLENELKVIPMSSSATGSGRDGDDPSVNQDGGGTFDFVNTGMELDSIPMNVDTAYGFTDKNQPVPVGNAEVIVLSDSDDENDLLSSGNIYGNNGTETGGVNFPVSHPVITNTYSGDPAMSAGGNSCLGLFNTNDEDFGNLWSLSPGNQANPGFQLFNSDAGVTDTLVNMHPGSINCPSAQMNGYSLAPDSAMGSTSLATGSTVGQTAADITDSLVDNPLAFAREDPSLHLFLPTNPSNASMQSDMRDHGDASNGIRTEDWISLRLGGDASGGPGDSPATNGLNSRQPVHTKDGGMDSLADTGSFSYPLKDFSFNNI